MHVVWGTRNCIRQLQPATSVTEQEPTPRARSVKWLVWRDIDSKPVGSLLIRGSGFRWKTVSEEQARVAKHEANKMHRKTSVKK